MAMPSKLTTTLLFLLLGSTIRPAEAARARTNEWFPRNLMADNGQNGTMPRCPYPYSGRSAPTPVPTAQSYFGFGRSE
ncbi:hypothetical protein EJ08DRAFT_694703 [Tothia fuscella]|uniref:Uncharacterized protein n=1 Tax=Tothia fuscella TaxID=1048955 RepID=A0A9P4U161_9PEZI|nr:hypothetical protein EJ08DRAFT_694703 [Tothia fuscella]